MYEEAAREQAASSAAPFMEALLSTSLEHPHIVRHPATNRQPPAADAARAQLHGWRAGSQTTLSNQAQPCGT